MNNQKMLDVVTMIANIILPDEFDHGSALEIWLRAMKRKAREALESHESEAVGNMAAIREALERMTDWMEKHTALFSVQVCPRQDDPDEVERLRDEAISRARAALSAPARNCDLYNDVEDSWQDYKQFRRQTGEDVYFDMVHFWPFAKWLLAPAEERKGEDYGK